MSDNSCPFGCHSYTMQEPGGSVTIFTLSTPDCNKHGLIGSAGNVLIFSEAEVAVLRLNLVREDKIRSRLAPGVRVTVDANDVEALLSASDGMPQLISRLLDLAGKMDTSRPGTPAEMRGPRDRYNKRRK